MATDTGVPSAPSAADDKYKFVEQSALDRAAKSSDIDEQLKSTGLLKDITAARSANEALRYQRAQFLVGTLAPVIAIVGVLITVVVQYRQFHKTLVAQNEQFLATATIQKNSAEDAQWREALKSVSGADAKDAATGALVMQGFFSSDRYGPQAHAIASVLLANVRNVGVFDEVLTKLRDHTDTSNVGHVLELAQTLGLTQRARLHIKAAVPTNAPFLDSDVNGINPNAAESDEEATNKSVAWELDTISHALLQLWRDPKYHVSPRGAHLSGAVVENYDFSAMDFKDANFKFAVLNKANFKDAIFDGASFKSALVINSRLDNASFNHVINFEGSVWHNSNWYDAKCIPAPMLAYLTKVDPQNQPPNAARLTSGCR